MLPVRKRDRLVSNAHRRAPRQEKELAQRLGGRTVKGSGSGDEKGDVRLRGIVRIEAKTTTRNSFAISKALIDKIEEAAVSSGEIPAFVIEFLDEAGRPTHECAVVPTWALAGILKSPA